MDNERKRTSIGDQSSTVEMVVGRIKNRTENSV